MDEQGRDSASTETTGQLQAAEPDTLEAAEPDQLEATEPDQPDPHTSKRLTHTILAKTPPQHSSLSAACLSLPSDVHDECPRADDDVQLSTSDPQNVSVESVQPSTSDPNNTPADNVKHSGSDSSHLTLDDVQLATSGNNNAPADYMQLSTSDPNNVPPDDVQPSAYDPSDVLVDDVQPSTSDLTVSAAGPSPPNGLQVYDLSSAQDGDMRPSTPDSCPVTSSSLSIFGPSPADHPPSAADPRLSTSDPSLSTSDPYPAIPNSSSRELSPLKCMQQLQALVRQQLQTPQEGSSSRPRTQAEVFASLPENQLNCLIRKKPCEWQDLTNMILAHEEVKKRVQKMALSGNKFAQQLMGLAQTQPVSGETETCEALSGIPVQQPAGRVRRSSSTNRRLQQSHLGASLDTTGDLPRILVHVHANRVNRTRPARLPSGGHSGVNLVTQQTESQTSGEGEKEEPKVDRQPIHQNPRQHTHEHKQCQSLSQQSQDKERQTQQSSCSTKSDARQEQKSEAKQLHSTSVPRRQIDRQTQTQQNASSQKRTEMTCQLPREQAEQAYRSRLLRLAYLTEEEVRGAYLTIPELEQLAEAMQSQGGPTYVMPDNTKMRLLPASSVPKVFRQARHAKAVDQQWSNLQTATVPLPSGLTSVNAVTVPRPNQVSVIIQPPSGNVLLHKNDANSIVLVQTHVSNNQGIVTQPAAVSLHASTPGIAGNTVHVVVQSDVSQAQGVVAQLSTVSVQPSASSSTQNVVVDTDVSRGLATQSSFSFRSATPSSNQNIILNTDASQGIAAQPSTVSLPTTVQSSAPSGGRQPYYLVPIVKDPCTPADNTIISTGGSSPDVPMNSAPVVLPSSVPVNVQDQTCTALVPSNSRSKVLVPSAASMALLQPVTQVLSNQTQAASTAGQPSQVLLNMTSQAQVMNLIQTAPNRPSIQVIAPQPATPVVAPASVSSGVSLLPAQASVALYQNQGSSSGASQQGQPVFVHGEFGDSPKPARRGRPPTCRGRSQLKRRKSAQRKKRGDSDDASDTGKPKRSSRKQSFRGVRSEEPDFVTVEISESDADESGAVAALQSEVAPSTTGLAKKASDFEDVLPQLLLADTDVTNQDALSEASDADLNKCTEEEILRVLNMADPYENENIGVDDTPNDASSRSFDASQTTSSDGVYGATSIQTPQPPDHSDGAFNYLETLDDDTSLDQFLGTPYNYEDGCDEPDAMSALLWPDRDPLLSSASDPVLPAVAYASYSCVDSENGRYSSEKPSTTGVAEATPVDVTTQMFRPIENLLEGVGREQPPPLNSTVQVLGDPAEGHNIVTAQRRTQPVIIPSTSHSVRISVDVHVDGLEGTSGQTAAEQASDDVPYRPRSAEKRRTSHSGAICVGGGRGTSLSAGQAAAEQVSHQTPHQTIYTSTCAVRRSAGQKKNNRVVKESIPLTSELAKTLLSPKSPEESGFNPLLLPSHVVNSAPTQASVTDTLKSRRRRARSATPSSRQSRINSSESRHPETTNTRMARGRGSKGKVSSLRASGCDRSRSRASSNGRGSASRRKSEGKVSLVRASDRSRSRVSSGNRRSATRRRSEGNDSPRASSSRSSVSGNACSGVNVLEHTPNMSTNPPSRANAQVGARRRRSVLKDSSFGTSEENTGVRDIQPDQLPAQQESTNLHEQPSGSSRTSQDNAGVQNPESQPSGSSLENANFQDSTPDPLLTLQEHTKVQDPRHRLLGASAENTNHRENSTTKFQKNNPQLTRLLKLATNTRGTLQNTDSETDTASENPDEACSDHSKNTYRNRRESDSDTDDKNAGAGSRSAGTRRSARLQRQETRSRDGTKRSNTSGGLGNIKKQKNRTATDQLEKRNQRLDCSEPELFLSVV